MTDEEQIELILLDNNGERVAILEQFDRAMVD
jgi:hypothetical protein